MRRRPQLAPTNPYSPDICVPPKATLSAREVHEVVDLIGEQFTKYYNLLTASTYVLLVPVIQHDWLAAFRVPWMPPGYTPQDSSVAAAVSGCWGR